MPGGRVEELKVSSMAEAFEIMKVFNKLEGKRADCAIDLMS